MDNKIEEEVVVNQEKGLHLRVASDVVSICKKYEANITLSRKECPAADACSILSVLSLGAHQGDTLTVTASGNDAQKAVDEISQYFSEGGGI